MPDTNEKTMAQRAPWWNLRGWFGGRGYEMLPAVKSQHGSGADDNTNPYDRTWCASFAEVGHAAGIDGAPLPGTLANYRAMNAHPTLALAQAAIVLSVLSAEWLVTVDDDLAKDKTAQFGKEILERELIGCRTQFLRDCLRCLCYGFQAFEVVYVGKHTNDGREYTGCQKIKALLPDWTIARVDDHGNLLEVKQGAATLADGEYLWIAYEKEGDNWYGRSRHENVRRTWSNALTLEDNKMRLSRFGTGIIPYVGVPADSQEDKDAGRTPSMSTGQGIIRSLMAGVGVVYTNLVGIDPREISNDPKLAGASNISVDTVDLGQPGGTISAIGAEQDRLDKYMVRGWLQPERTLTEATMGGSRADSESHGDLSLADAETVHELIVEQINKQLSHRLILENCGDKYADRIRLVAAPIQDEQKRQLSVMVAALLTDPQFRAGLVDSIGDEGLQSIFDRLGVGIKLAEPFEPMIGDEPEPKPDAPTPNDDDEAN